ncbi:MAG: hypothetical protein QXH03_05740 [Candidatus Bathyarchaeia archaeon]
MEVEMEKVDLDERLVKVGQRFCEVVTEAELNAMQRAIRNWEKGETVEMARALEEVKFIHEVASLICEKEEKRE